MANTLKALTLVTKNAATYLHNSMSAIKCFDNQYDSQFSVSGRQGGGSLQVRIPPQFTVSTGAALSVQDVTETTETIPRSTQKHIDFAFTSEQLANYIENEKQIDDLYIKPAMARLASQVEYDVMAGVYSSIYNQAGTAGTSPATADAILQAGEYLNQFCTPDDGERYLVINPKSQRSLLNGLSGLYNNQKTIGEQYVKGYLGDQLGFKIYMDQNVPAHTNGTQGGTPLINGGSQTGASLVTDGWSAGATVKAGTVITIGSTAANTVYAVNPETKVQQSNAQQFVVTADGTADGSGNLTLSISPSIVTSGATQTVSGSPGDNVAISVAGSASSVYGINLAFHRQAIAFITADLPTQLPGAIAHREVLDGVSLRALHQYDKDNDRLVMRFDVLYGYKLIRPQFACRLIGA
jgi:hypothetical protein